MLCAVGDLVEDVVAHLDAPLRTGADAPARVSRHRGGSAANVAAAAARLGGRSRFVGAVGDDETGVRLVDALAALGVDCRVQRRGRTGTIVALVGADGERTFVTDRGAATDLAPPGPDVLTDVDVLHIPGYGLGGGGLTRAVAGVAALARDRRIPVSVDPSSLTLGRTLGIGPYRTAIEALGPTVLLPNRVEAEQLDLVNRPLAPLTVVTAGSDPTVVVDRGRCTEVEVPAVTVTDTTGAGDAFAAAFLTSWLSGAAPPGAVARGHAAAARVVGGPGADWWGDES